MKWLLSQIFKHLFLVEEQEWQPVSWLNESWMIQNLCSHSSDFCWMTQNLLSDSSNFCWMTQNLLSGPSNFCWMTQNLLSGPSNFLSVSSNFSFDVASCHSLIKSCHSCSSTWNECLQNWFKSFRILLHRYHPKKATNTE